MENTLENKVKFMSAHIYCANIYIEFENSPQHNYGQRLTPTVLGHVEFGRQLFFGGTYPNIERAYLELKPLSSISDEDVVYIGSICGDKRPIKDAYDDDTKKYILRKRGLGSLQGIFGIEFNYGHIFNPEYKNSLQIIDYLRSKGYALPWMGLSVKELVNRGWVKLKSE